MATMMDRSDCTSRSPTMADLNPVGPLQELTMGRMVMGTTCPVCGTDAVTLGWEW